MKNIQKILNAVLAKDIFEYILIDETLCVVSSSSGVENYVGKALVVGDEIAEYLPEFVGSDTVLKDIFSNPLSTYVLESVRKKEYYVDICVEYFDETTLLILMNNITDTILSSQKLLQYSNESILLGSTLQKILDRQNALLFVTNNNHITYSNEQFLAYFGIHCISDLPRKKLNIYQYMDPSLTNYEALFERLKSKETYVDINNDTFILKANKIEDTHTLFTLTNVTNLSHEIQKDTLTGMYKKDFFDRRLESIVQKKEDAVVVVIDIDDYKVVNDTYGHQIGDSVLKEFASLIQDNIRTDDTFVRWGGEEFLLLLQHTTVEDAMQKVEWLRRCIETHHFSHVANIQASFGVASKAVSDNLHTLLKRADEALYEAKEQGKNKVIFKKL